MAYHTLVERIDGAWHPQFGDYDRETVVAERDDMIDHGTKRADLRIISTTSARQPVIDAAIARLARIVAPTTGSRRQDIARAR